MQGTVLTNRSAVDRNKTDFYETPPEVTVALLDFLESKGLLDSGRDAIWEPACGAGKMADIMQKRGYAVYRSDLHDMGCGEIGVDFLTTERPCTWIITNPPFSLANDFIRHALELGKPCAFLLKSQFWHARSRLQLFRDHPPSYVLPLTWRPDFLYGAKSGSPTMEILWTVWGAATRRSIARWRSRKAVLLMAENKDRLCIVPVSLAEANAFVEQHHRHHKPVVGHKFSIGCALGEKVVGVAIVGRPVARYLDDGWTLEVNRLCTDGTKNACSMLYAAAWRAARAMGYKKLVTYILESERGSSLKAAGWKCVGQAGGLRWTGKRKPEVDLYPAQMKIRFEMGE